MAVAGLLVHCWNRPIEEVTMELDSMPEMTTFGSKDGVIVVVAESPTTEMERRVKSIERIDGVVAVYTAYVSIEDEI